MMLSIAPITLEMTDHQPSLANISTLLNAAVSNPLQFTPSGG
jgi:hypothetical protein